MLLQIITTGRFTQHLKAACIRQHMSAYVSIRQHTPAYVSMRQHTSARQLLNTRRKSVFALLQLLSQYLYFCTSKASKLSTSTLAGIVVEMRPTSVLASTRAIAPACSMRGGTQFTCFTSTKVQILTQKLEMRPTSVLASTRAIAPACSESF